MQVDLEISADESQNLIPLSVKGRNQLAFSRAASFQLRGRFMSATFLHRH